MDSTTTTAKALFGSMPIDKAFSYFRSAMRDVGLSTELVRAPGSNVVHVVVEGRVIHQVKEVRE